METSTPVLFVSMGHVPSDSFKSWGESIVTSIGIAAACGSEPNS